MNILLVAATANEISPTLKWIRRNGRNLDVDILISGIGLLRSCYSISRQVALKKPGLLMQCGVAGSFDNKNPPGSVVVVSKDTVGDLGVVENGKWKTIADLGLEAGGFHPSVNGWLENTNRRLLSQSGLKKVKAVSINQISTDEEVIRLIRKRFSPDIETMEGASVHFIGLMEKIPFLQIRAISNYIGERDKKKWKLDLAIKSLNQTLLHLFENIAIKK